MAISKLILQQKGSVWRVRLIVSTNFNPLISSNTSQKYKYSSTTFDYVSINGILRAYSKTAKSTCTIIILPDVMLHWIHTIFTEDTCYWAILKFSSKNFNTGPCDTEYHCLIKNLWLCLDYLGCLPCLFSKDPLFICKNTWISGEHITNKWLFKSTNLS